MVLLNFHKFFVLILMLYPAITHWLFMPSGCSSKGLLRYVRDFVFKQFIAGEHDRSNLIIVKPINTYAFQPANINKFFLIKGWLAIK